MPEVSFLDIPDSLVEASEKVGSAVDEILLLVSFILASRTG